MFCVRCGRRDLTHGKRCIYCKTRLVYPADLRFLSERDARQRNRRLVDDRAEQGSDLPRETARTEAFAEKTSDRPRRDTRKADASKKSMSDRLHEDGKANAPSGKNASERERENAAAEKVGTSGRWSLFDRAREETKMAARPGFVEKAEASAKARAEEKAGQAERRSTAEKVGRVERRNAEETNSRADRRGTVEKTGQTDRRNAEEKAGQTDRRNTAEKVVQAERRSVAEKAGRVERRNAEEKNSRADRRGTAEKAGQVEQRRTAAKADKANLHRSAGRPHGSGNPVVRLPERRAGSSTARPVVRLPEKRRAHPGTKGSSDDGRFNYAEQWNRAGEEALKRARRQIRLLGKTFRRAGHTLKKQARSGKNWVSERIKSSSESPKPVRTAVKPGASMRGSASARNGGAPGRSQPPRRAGQSSVRGARAYARSEPDRESFLERHLRSLIAMALLAVTVIVFCVWSTSTASGKRTFAQLGIGGASGYILLGDDCMESGNYARAVEHYYRALKQHTSYESAAKLAQAYRMTGDTEREASVLLLCVDRFETEREPYKRLKELYPDLTRRPETVQNALNRGAHVLGDASIAQ